MLKLLVLILACISFNHFCLSNTPEFSSSSSESRASITKSFLDNSIDLFFPESLKDIQLLQTQYRLFWWNFIIIDPDAMGVPDWKKAKKVCEDLSPFQSVEIQFIFCGNSELIQFLPVLQNWSEDLLLRKEFPKEPLKRLAFIKKSRQTINQLAYTSDPQLLRLLQLDPFGSWEEFLEISQKNLSSQFKKENGFFFDDISHRIIIPIQFKVPPQMEFTKNFFNHFTRDSNIHIIGTHQSSFQNEKTVKEDLSIVSWVSTLSLLLLILFLILNKRSMAILLILPVSLGLLLAAIVTLLHYGTIHGLSLAFGSAIAGLALDYALHGAFNSESKQTWISNSIGLLTTLTGLISLFFCRIPLIEQMMFFAIGGIIFGFGSSYLICEFFPQYFHLKSLSFKLPAPNRLTSIMLLFFIFGWLLIFKTEFSFDLRRFNYQTPDQKSITDWFYQSQSTVPTYLFSKTFDESFIQSPSEWEWSLQNKSHYEGVSHYFPSLEKQKQNLRSWSTDACKYFQKHWTKSEAKLYHNFLSKICHSTSFNIQLDSQFYSQRKYLLSYIGQNHFLSLLRIPSPTLEVEFKKIFPKSISIAESLKSFSSILSEDLRWMIPTSLILSLLILGLYYKSLKSVFSSILPFLSGVGCFFMSAFVFNDTIDLISVLGLVMVFGFSIDYGVFATDLYVKNTEALKIMTLNQLETSVFSTLSLAGLTNLIGFFPLLFAKHIVLHQLGFALFFGTLGTYLGALWGIPMLLKKPRIKIFSEKLPTKGIGS